MMDATHYTNMVPMRYFHPKEIPADFDYSKYIATQKYDGEWCRIVKSGDTIIAQSRAVSKRTGTYGDNTPRIPHIIDRLAQIPADFVLLGELCYPEMITTTSNDVGRILRANPDVALMRQQTLGKLSFVAFDCLYYGEPLENMPYELRKRSLERFYEEYVSDTDSNITLVRTNPEGCSVDDFVNDILDQGGEGCVLHKKDSLYSPGKRPAWDTIKIKREELGEEFLVVGTVDPSADYAGKNLDEWTYFKDGCAVTKDYYFGRKAGVVIQTPLGTCICVTSGVNTDDKTWLATEEARQMIADGELVAEVSCMERIGDNMRHPRLVRLRRDA